MKTSAVLCIALVALSTAVNASFASFFAEDDPEAVAQRDPIRGTTGLALLPASPDCWLDAIQALKIQTGSVLEEAFYAASSEGHADGSHALNSLTCSWLTSVDQKVLALELSKCQLQDLERALFKFDDDKGHEACSMVLQDYRKVQVEGTEKQRKLNQAKMSRDITSSCLSRLTDNGVNTYTHFFSYVNQICTRLLSEFVLGQYYETSHHLASSSKVAEEKIQKIIEQQDQLFKSWTEREELVLGMYDELETRVVKQTDGLESKIANLRSKLEEEHKHWKDEYHQFKGRLESELEKHQKEFAVFARVVQKIQETWFSWTTPIESLWQKIQVGHSLFRGIFLYFGSLFCSLILTWPRPLRWLRAFMAMVLMIGLMVEVGILFTTRPGQDKASFWREEYLQQCEILRVWLFAILYSYYSLGVVRSIIYAWCKVTEEGEAAHAIDVNAPTIQNLFQPSMQPFASQMPRQFVGSSAFQSPAMFIYGRTQSKDDSAGATDASHDTGDQRSAPVPNFVLENGMTSYGIYHPYAPPPQAAMAHNLPGTFAPLAKTSEKPRIGAGPAQGSATAASPTRKSSLVPPGMVAPPQNLDVSQETPCMTPVVNQLQGVDMENKKHVHGDGSSKKRPISDVTEAETENKAKRSRCEEPEEDSNANKNENHMEEESSEEEDEHNDGDIPM